MHRRWLESGELVEILADWSDETYLLYAYHLSRHLPPAKVSAFLDFVQGIWLRPGERRRITNP
jgi:DNA-binding transcriptional LysR family regulator